MCLRAGCLPRQGPRSASWRSQPMKLSSALAQAQDITLLPVAIGTAGAEQSIAVQVRGLQGAAKPLATVVGLLERSGRWDDAGRARMVDVTQKASTERIATAQGKVFLLPETLETQPVKINNIIYLKKQIHRR